MDETNAMKNVKLILDASWISMRLNPWWMEADGTDAWVRILWVASSCRWTSEVWIASGYSDPWTPNSTQSRIVSWFEGKVI